MGREEKKVLVYIKRTLAILLVLAIILGGVQTLNRVLHGYTSDWYHPELYPKNSVDVAFVGRPSKRSGYDFGDGVDIIEGLPRTRLLEAMAEYRQVYAVGRTAIEAKILGCEVLPYDRRFPDAERWQIMDNRDAAQILQKKLEVIDS